MNEENDDCNALRDTEEPCSHGDLASSLTALSDPSPRDQPTERPSVRRNPRRACFAMVSGEARVETHLPRRRRKAAKNGNAHPRRRILKKPVCGESKPKSMPVAPAYTTTPAFPTYHEFELTNARIKVITINGVSQLTLQSSTIAHSGYHQAQATNTAAPTAEERVGESTVMSASNRGTWGDRI